MGRTSTPLASLLLIAALVAGCERGSELQPPDNSTVASSRSGGGQQQETASGTAAATKDSSAVDVESELSQIQRNVSQGRLDAAWSKVQELLVAYPDTPDLLLTAAEVLMRRGELEAGRDLLQSLKTDDAKIQVKRLQLLASSYIAEGRLSEAVEPASKLLELNPKDPAAHRLLVEIYHAQGRRYIAEPHLIALVESGEFDAAVLLLLGDLERIAKIDQRANAMANVPAERHHYLTYQACQMLAQGRFEAASDLLSDALRLNPEALETWIWLGNCLWRMGEENKLHELLADPPTGAEEHPKYWVLLGLRWEQSEDSERAAYAYFRALQLDPRSRAATSGLARSLLPLGYAEIVRQLNARGKLLQEADQQALDLSGGYVDSPTYGKLIEAYARLDLDILRDAWATLQKRLPPDQQKEIVSVDAQDRLPIAPILAELSMRSWPDVDLEALAEDPPSDKDSKISESDQPQFALIDVTDKVGLQQITYDWGKKPTEPDVPLYRTLGGGAAVLDFDNDGRPDLYFSVAGGDWEPVGSNDAKRLFRNTGGEFREVSKSAGAQDLGYGQAVLVQDLDQDGTDDLIVCNLGSLRIYYNLGDGTFDRAIELPLHNDNFWITTAAIADFNGDRLPDIYGVTYVAERDFLTTVCYSHTDGTPSVCGPQTFPGGRDYLWINQADNSWKDDQALLKDSDTYGRGLGALVSDIDGQPGLELYITNDTSANELLRFDQHGGSVVITSLVSSGTALSATGEPEGSMGIALSDLDHNMLEDLLVTNFKEEGNEVLLQQAPSLFRNASRSWGMDREDYPLVGFGVQAIDLDQDSWDDLLVVNGHVEDETDRGGLFRMLPLLYRNVGTKFQLLDAASVSEYFRKPVLARGLTNLDYDGDLKSDLVVTHTDEAAVLLRNETRSGNNAIQLELIGVDCERCAIGAVIDITAGDKTWRKSLALGEGYYGSDQRLIEIGLGEHRQADKIEITWPDGPKQAFDEVKAGRRYRLIQHDELEPIE